MRKDGSVVLEMEEVDPSVPFYRQGNMAVSTVEAYKERFMLKASPRVRDALHSWWLMAPRVKRTMPPFGFPVEVLMQDGYSSVMRAAYRVLCEDSSWDDPELDAQIAHDWEVDADGKDHMPRERFADSIFELADLWTTTISEAVYKDFLMELAPRVQRAVEEDKVRSSREVSPRPPMLRKRSTKNMSTRSLLPIDAPPMEPPAELPAEPLGGHKFARQATGLLPVPPPPPPQRQETAKIQSGIRQKKRLELVRAKTSELSGDSLLGTLAQRAADLPGLEDADGTLSPQWWHQARMKVQSVVTLTPRSSEREGAGLLSAGTGTATESVPPSQQGPRISLPQSQEGGPRVSISSEARKQQRPKKKAVSPPRDFRSTPPAGMPRPQPRGQRGDCYWTQDIRYSEPPAPGSAFSSRPVSQRQPRLPALPSVYLVRGDHTTWYKSGQSLERPHEEVRRPKVRSAKDMPSPTRSPQPMRPAPSLRVSRRATPAKIRIRKGPPSRQKELPEQHPTMLFWVSPTASQNQTRHASVPRPNTPTGTPREVES